MSPLENQYECEKCGIYLCEECGIYLCEECCFCEPNEIEEEDIVEEIDDSMDIDYYWDETLDLFVEI